MPPATQTGPVIGCGSLSRALTDWHNVGSVNTH